MPILNTFDFKLGWYLENNSHNSEIICQFNSFCFQLVYNFIVLDWVSSDSLEKDYFAFNELNWMEQKQQPNKYEKQMKKKKIGNEVKE